MSERRGRGHRKLCLCSNKYYEKKKYFPKSLLVSIPKRTVSILPFSIPIDLVTFRVSLPLAAYSESPVPSLKVLVDRILHLRALTEGWKYTLEKETLCFHQLITSEAGRVVGLSLVIKSDYSWAVSYRNEIVSVEHCTMLKKIPLHINSVNIVCQLLATLNACKVCEGNSDGQYTSLPSIHEGVMKNQTRTEIVAKVDSKRTGVLSVYHVDCEMLIESSEGAVRCRSCKKHRRCLLAICSRSQKDDRTHPSSHTNYSCLTNEEKDEQLRRMHTDISIAKLRLSQLEKKISESAARDGIELDHELHCDMKQIIVECSDEICQSYQPESFQHIFWELQKKAASLKDSRSMKWHPLVIKWCLYLRHLSSKGYETLRHSGCIKLPSQRTLRDYTHYTNATIGFSADVDQHLVVTADLSKDLNKYVVLIMDEVHIKEELVYDKHQGSLIGFVNLGATNNQLLEYETSISQSNGDRPLASPMLVFMVRGLFAKLNYPYAQFACDSLCGEQLFNPVWEAIARLERLGFHVLALTCDGASPNRKFWKLHSDDDMTYKVPNPYASTPWDLYFISDPPYLLKTIRNSWFNSKRKLLCNGKSISCRHLETVYLQDTASLTSPRLVPKLKYEHVHLTSFSKMRVDLAAQVLSEQVANALEQYCGEEVTETVRFVRMMDKFFDCLNVSNFSSGKHKKKSFQDPYRRAPGDGPGTNDFRLKWLKGEFLPYLQQWQQSVDARKGPYTPKDKAMMVLTQETRFGIHATVCAFVEYIFTIPGVEYFFSEQLCQDPLEKFFGCQRQRGKSNENPNVQQFCSNTQALRVINGTCANVSKGNCRGNKAKIDWEQENCPLPKRHRKKLTDKQRPASTVAVQCQEMRPASTVAVQCQEMRPASTVAEMRPASKVTVQNQVWTTMAVQITMIIHMDVQMLN